MNQRIGVIQANRGILLPVGIAILGLWFGFVAGSSAAEGRSFFAYFVRSSIPVPGMRADRSFVFADFESGQALEAWQAHRAKIEVSPHHAKEGRGSAFVSFFSHSKLSSISMKNYFTSRRALFNWSQYQTLSFYVFNQQDDTKRIILQIGDRKGRLYKQDFYAPGNEGKTFVVPISRIANEINVERIDELSFFQWNLSEGFYLYFDEVKLTS